MVLEIGQIISIIALAVSIYFNSHNAKKSDGKEIEERAIETTRAMTEMNMTLKAVAKNVEAIMTELCDTKDQVADHNLRLTITESGLKDTAREVNELREDLQEIHDKVVELTERIAKLEK